ncbi:MAG: Uma2 family endonuclease [Tunicatimonas sp.]
METLVVNQSPLTAEAYLEAEHNGTREDYGKYEYHNGELVLMGGASKEHNRVSVNLILLIGSQLAKKPYELFHSDMRTFAPDANSYFYPDLVVCQGEAQFKDDAFDNLINPALVIEILSPSTKAKDRDFKFEAYRSIATLNEYLLIAPDGLMIEHYQRQQPNEWKLTIYQQTDETLRLLDGAVALRLTDIYQNVVRD